MKPKENEKQQPRKAIGCGEDKWLQEVKCERIKDPSDGAVGSGSVQGRLMKIMGEQLFLQTAVQVCWMKAI